MLVHTSKEILCSHSRTPAALARALTSPHLDLPCTGGGHILGEGLQHAVPAARHRQHLQDHPRAVLQPLVHTTMVPWTAAVHRGQQLYCGGAHGRPGAPAPLPFYLGHLSKQQAHLHDAPKTLDPITLRPLLSTEGVCISAGRRGILEARELVVH